MMECGKPSLFFTLSIGPQREIGLLIEPKNTYINHIKINFGGICTYNCRNLIFGDVIRESPFN